MNRPFRFPNSSIEHRTERAYAHDWLPRGMIHGFVLSNGTSDPTNDIDIGAGLCRSTSNFGPNGHSNIDRYQRDLELPAEITKRLNNPWAPHPGGAASGGRSSAALADGAWHCFIIGGPGRQDDAFFHNSANPAGFLPSGYNSYRRVGAVLRNGGSIRRFRQYGDHFMLNVPVQDVLNTSDHQAAQAAILSVPTGVRLEALIRVGAAAGSAGHGVLVTSNVADNIDPLPNAGPGLTAAAADASGNKGWASAIVFTDTNATVRYRSSHSSVVTLIMTDGWVDRRGRDS